LGSPLCCSPAPNRERESASAFSLKRKTELPQAAQTRPGSCSSLSWCWLFCFWQNPLSICDWAIIVPLSYTVSSPVFQKSKQPQCTQRCMLERPIRLRLRPTLVELTSKESLRRLPASHFPRHEVKVLAGPFG